MYVVTRIIGGIELHDPVNSWYLNKSQIVLRYRGVLAAHVKTSCSYVCADQRALLCVAERKEGVGPFLLLLLAVQIKHWQIDVIKQLRMIFHAIAAGKENNDLLL